MAAIKANCFFTFKTMPLRVAAPLSKYKVPDVAISNILVIDLVRHSHASCLCKMAAFKTYVPISCKLCHEEPIYSYLDMGMWTET